MLAAGDLRKALLPMMAGTSKKKGSKLVQERVIRCAEAKKLKEWGLGADEPGML